MGKCKDMLIQIFDDAERNDARDLRCDICVVCAKIVLFVPDW